MDEAAELHRGRAPSAPRRPGSGAGAWARVRRATRRASERDHREGRRRSLGVFEADDRAPAAGASASPRRGAGERAKGAGQERQPADRSDRRGLEAGDQAGSIARCGNEGRRQGRGRRARRRRATGRRRARQRRFCRRRFCRRPFGRRFTARAAPVAHPAASARRDRHPACPVDLERLLRVQQRRQRAQHLTSGRVDHLT